MLRECPDSFDLAPVAEQMMGQQGASKRARETRDLDDVVDRPDAAMAVPDNA